MFLIEYKEIFLGPDIIILCAFNRPKCYSISINVPLIKCHSINYVSTKFTRLQIKKFMQSYADKKFVFVIILG